MAAVRYARAARVRRVSADGDGGGESFDPAPLQILRQVHVEIGQHPLGLLNLPAKEEPAFGPDAGERRSVPSSLRARRPPAELVSSVQGSERAAEAVRGERVPPRLPAHPERVLFGQPPPAASRVAEVVQGCVLVDLEQRPELGHAGSPGGDLEIPVLPVVTNGRSNELGGPRRVGGTAQSGCRSSIRGRPISERRGLKADSHEAYAVLAPVAAVRRRNGVRSRQGHDGGDEPLLDGGGGLVVCGDASEGEESGGEDETDLLEHCLPHAHDALRVDNPPEGCERLFIAKKSKNVNQSVGFYSSWNLCYSTRYLWVFFPLQRRVVILALILAMVG